MGGADLACDLQGCAPMNRLVLSLPVLALTLATFACGSSSSSEGGADGGASATNPGSAANTLSCLAQLNGFEPQCQFYEATGADASKTLAQLRAGCIDQAGATAKVLDACPTAKGLGGCKTPITVQGGADVKLFITNFEYEPTKDAGLGAHNTAERVKSFCESQGATATYVPAR